MELIRNIECECGQWEQFPADMPRDASQTFTWLENIENSDNDAHYSCPDCGTIVVSTIFETPTEEDYVEHECLWCGAPCEKDFCSGDCARQWVAE
jgi:predicted RNA-binding Zn-ribbon protein involved in translation (DUF1610 family)